MDCIDEHGADRFVFIKSLKICQRKDAEKMAPVCIPLMLDTHDEDQFTHERGVGSHLDMMSDITRGSTWPKNCCFVQTVLESICCPHKHKLGLADSLSAILTVQL